MQQKANQLCTGSDYLQVWPEELPQIYPKPHWKQYDFALTYRLLDVLERNDGLRRTVLTEERKSAIGKSRTVAYREIAVKVFGALPAYAIYFADPAGHGTHYYGSSIKPRIYYLQKHYDLAKQRLGIAGADLPSEWGVGETWDSVRKEWP